jgi:lipopolysaccharide/colanic/teichoic acid biosynthesis glycosyltransferase
MLLIGILIKFDSQGPVFFKQTRVGRNGRKFKIFKFRTMVVDAEKLGMQITVGKDSRITGTGRFLRKYKIDELPQLINVLKGDMSFVGPRPEVPKYVSLYTEDQKNILKISPGITDYASIEYKDENDILALSENPEKTYIEEIMPRKINLNMKYIKNISLPEDIKIIIKTIAAVLR